MKPQESYKILVDWSKYQHEKMQHFNTVNIAIHTLIITAIGYIIYYSNKPLLPLKPMGCSTSWIYSGINVAFRIIETPA